MNILLIVVLCAFSFVSSTSMHTHKRPGQKEREDDGSYIRRDSGHYDEEGKHNANFDHEAILGSKNEADEFDSLPPEVAKEKLKELALKMDTNEDEFIDRVELKNWVLKSFRMLSKEEAEDKFEEEDENMDGKVSWPEHLNEVFGSYIDDKEYVSEDPDQEKLKNEDKQLFASADTNKDGFLNVEEFVAFTNPEEHEHMFEVLYQRTLIDKDKDGDKHLNLNEFIGDYGKDNKEHYIIEKKRFEEEFDENKDGKLDRQEILKWLIPNNNEIADDEVDHLFGETDENKDDKLSIQEIVDNHEVFVGSEATDYGEHLHDTNKFNHEEL